MKQMKNNMEKWVNLKVFGNADILNTTTTVLLWLLEITDNRTLEAIVTPDRAKEFRDRCQISQASYYRSMKELEDKGIISNSHGGTITIPNCQEIRRSGEVPFIVKK